MSIVLALFGIATNYIELIPDSLGELLANFHRLLDTSNLVQQKLFPKFRRQHSRPMRLILENITHNYLTLQPQVLPSRQ